MTENLRTDTKTLYGMRRPPFFGADLVTTNDPSPTAQFLAMLGRRSS
jgi:hypothetical protein